jgi:restriction endonuclease S subunit
MKEEGSTDVPAIAGSGVHVIRVRPAVILPQYLHWWINHPSTQKKLVTDIARGSTVPFVSKGDLELVDVPLPPIAVQRQIVEVERLRTRERELRKQLESLQQQLVDSATLSAAVRNRSREH